LRGTRRTLIRVLETMMRLVHPIMPFITEEIWQKMSALAGKQGKTIMLQPYPECEPNKIDLSAEAEVDWVMQFVLGVRKIKGEMNIAPGKRVPILLSNVSKTDRTMLKANRHYVEFLGKAASVEILPEGQEKPESAMTLLGEMNILIPLEGLIDKQAEISRLDKALKKTNLDVDRLEAKIGNPGFAGKAPPEVVEKERQKLTDSIRVKEELESQIKQLMN